MVQTAIFNNFKKNKNIYKDIFFTIQPPHNQHGNDLSVIRQVHICDNSPITAASAESSLLKVFWWICMKTFHHTKTKMPTFVLDNDIALKHYFVNLAFISNLRL